jgi:hypothetical protein
MPTCARRLTAVVLLAALLGGCTGYKKVALGAIPPSGAVLAVQMKAGQHVRVGLRDGASQTMTIKSIEGDVLAGTHGERVPLSDIVTIERRAVDISKTLWLSLGVYFLAATIVFAGHSSP